MKPWHYPMTLLLALSSDVVGDRPTGASITRRDFEGSQFHSQTTHFDIYHDCVSDEGCVNFQVFEQTYQVVQSFFSRLGLPLRRTDGENRMRVRIFNDWESPTEKITAIGLSPNGHAALFVPAQNCVFLVAQFPGRRDPDLQAAYLRTVIQHEITHQVLAILGVVDGGVIYPTWISEGLPCLFEIPLPCCDKGTVPVNSLRLADIGSPDELPPIRSFVSGRHGDKENSPKAVLYARAWALAHFLVHRKTEEFRGYFQAIMRVQHDEGDVHSEAWEQFEAAFGPADELDREWREYVADLLVQAKRPEPQP